MSSLRNGLYRSLRPNLLTIGILIEQRWYVMLSCISNTMVRNRAAARSCSLKELMFPPCGTVSGVISTSLAFVRFTYAILSAAELDGFWCSRGAWTQESGDWTSFGWASRDFREKMRSRVDRWKADFADEILFFVLTMGPKERNFTLDDP